MLGLKIIPIAPVLRAITGTQTYAVRSTNPDKAAITPIVFTNAGGTVNSGSCTVADNLPTGLSAEVSGTTCAITGAPTRATAAKEYTITATNVEDITSMATVTIEVLAPRDFPPFVISDSTGLTSGNFYGVRDTSQAMDYSADATGHPKLSWSTTGGITTLRYKAAPSIARFQVGRDADPNTDPKTTVNLGDYSEGYVVFDIRVPNYGTYPDITVKSDSTDVFNTFEALGKVGDGRWQTVLVPVANYIGKGLDLAEVTTPFVIFPDETTQLEREELDFMIRNISWTNNPPAPDLADAADQSFIVGQGTIDPIVFENTGASATTCRIGSAGGPRQLPIGLVLEVVNGTCQITGAPAETAESGTYTIRATSVANITGTATVTIVVAPKAPVLTAITGMQTLTINQTTNLPIIFENTGGDVAEGGCSIASGTTPTALPVGLNVVVSGDTCAITGTPTMLTGLATYTIEATNVTNPASTATVMIEVKPKPQS